MTPRGFIAALTLFVTGLAAAPAFAQTSQGVDIAGSWAFESAPYFEGARFMRGDMVLSRTEDGEWLCSFTTDEYNTGEDEPFATSEQSCTVAFANNAIFIRSTVTGASSEFYAPDHFNLKVADPETMFGTIFSYSPMGPVTFRRQLDTIS